MEYISLPYKEVESMIEEGDVLLFRGKGFISYFIKALGNGHYSHVGLASWVHNKKGKRKNLECLEFSEKFGSRAVDLERYIESADNSGRVDVYRPVSNYSLWSFNPSVEDKPYQQGLRYKGAKLTSEFRSLTGLPYGWWRIWQLIKTHMLGLRLILRKRHLDDSEALKYPVCSTIIAHLFSKHYVDLVNLRSPNRTEPSDIARSPILNYLFTLT